MLAIEPTLFGEVAVVRRWARIGKRGGEKSGEGAIRRLSPVGLMATSHELAEATANIWLPPKISFET